MDTRELLVPCWIMVLMSPLQMTMVGGTVNSNRARAHVFYMTVVRYKLISMWRGTGVGNSGVMEAGSVRDAGEEGVGDGIPKGEIGNFAIEKVHRCGTTTEGGRNWEYKLQEAGNSDPPCPPPKNANCSFGFEVQSPHQS